MPRRPWERVSLVMVGLTLVAVISAMWGGPESGYDRYALPKELALHVAVWSFSLLTVSFRPNLSVSLMDAALLAMGMLGAFSLFGAPNIWYGFRALTLTVSASAALFTMGQLHRDRRVLFAIVALAGIAAALPMVAESVGLLPNLAMPGRGPAGTGGNRNFVAHILVLATPFLAFETIMDSNKLRRFLWATGLTLVALAVMISRCRAAWIALMVAGTVSTVAYALFMRNWFVAFSTLARRILPTVVLATLISTFYITDSSSESKATIQNTFSRLTEISSGTGQGRIVQYINSAAMGWAHLPFGVGAGNWSLVYPEFASANDPNIGADAFQPVNRLPNSDWMGLWSERGPGAIVLVFLMAWLLGKSAWTLLRSNNNEDRAHGLLIVSTAVAVGVLGSLDAVLQRAEPAILSAVIFATVPRNGSRTFALSRFTKLGVLALCCAFGVLTNVLIVRTLMARSLRSGDASDWMHAADLDPGDYVLRGRLAVVLANDERCAAATTYAHEVAELFPSSSIAGIVETRCKSPARAQKEVPFFQ